MRLNVMHAMLRNKTDSYLGELGRIRRWIHNSLSIGPSKMANRNQKPDGMIAPDFHDAYVNAPVTLIDVGARGGIQEKWDVLKPHLQVIGFEPDKEECERLSKSARPGMRFLNGALGARQERRFLNLTKAAGCSSILTPNAMLLSRYPDSERFEVVGRVEVEVCPLDDLLANDPSGDIDFIKLDAQGFEADIIKGAERTLNRQVLGLEVEVAFQPLYEGQATFHEIDAVLNKLGFQLFDLRPFFWKRSAGMNVYQARGQAVFADALYFRPPELDFSQINQGSLSKILHLASLYVVYGYLDCALAVLQANSREMNSSQKNALRGLAKTYDALAAPDIPWRRHRLHTFATRMMEKTDTHKNDPWAMARTLGNVD